MLNDQNDEMTSHSYHKTSMSRLNYKQYYNRQKNKFFQFIQIVF